MSVLKLYNTLTRKIEHFESREPGLVKLFTCGPSVYREPHLGNYRTYLYEDVLQKYLQYLGFTVERAINFTDVEDKAIDRAREKGLSLRELCRPVEKLFFKECNLLNIYMPAEIQRASAHVKPAVELVKCLIEKGHAYWHNGDVFYDPLTYKGFGRLYGLDMNRWPEKKVRFRKDTYPGRRWNRGDFILWHKRRRIKDEVWWDTEIGQGRPSWNIQDAAIIKQHLGDQIDIHTGGSDNLYRHHDYTLAIMESATGKEFCRWWLHGGELLVDGEKMSKSRGNVAYVNELMTRGFSPQHLRFFLLYGPYRDKLDLRISNLEQRTGHLDRIRQLACSVTEGESKDAEPLNEDLAVNMRRDFEVHMNDNLDYAGAFDAMAKHLDRTAHIDKERGIPAENREQLRQVLNDIDRVFGVLGCE